MAKSNYFSNTHTFQTRPTIDGFQSSVAYSTADEYKWGLPWVQEGYHQKVGRLSM